MNPVVIKSLIGVGAAGSVCAGAYGLHYHFSPKTVQGKLLWDGLTLLDLSADENNNKDKEEWTKKVEEYNKADSTQPKFADLSASVDAAKLKKECEKVLKVSLSDEGSEDKVKQAKAWCFKGTLENKKV